MRLIFHPSLLAGVLISLLPSFSSASVGTYSSPASNMTTCILFIFFTCALRNRCACVFDCNVLEVPAPREDILLILTAFSVRFKPPLAVQLVRFITKRCKSASLLLKHGSLAGLYTTLTIISVKPKAIWNTSAIPVLATRTLIWSFYFMHLWDAHNCVLLCNLQPFTLFIREVEKIIKMQNVS